MNIVVGYIKTPEGRAAIDRAIEEAKLRGGRIVVVHSSRGGVDDQEDATAYNDELEHVEAELRGLGLDVEVHDLVRGNEPAEDLVQMAEQVDAELIVIGLRRRSPVGKFIMGSNAQQVLLSAPCAVLAVKAAPQAQPAT